MSYLKERCHFSRILSFLFFLPFYKLLTDLVELKHINCIIFTLFYIQRQQICGDNHSEITVTATFTSGLDLCIFPCFKYIVYQIDSFALIAKCFPLTFIILVLFFVRNHRVSHHVRPPLRAPSWILNLKTLAQRFQVCYTQKHMREI